jgi:phosphate/sulfate permease
MGRKIVYAWIITIPASAAVAALALVLINLIGFR